MISISNLVPKNPTMFQVAWESTLKCNLDCSYCGDGHDNSTKHPSLEDSLTTVDFIVDYLDLYMSIKPPEQKQANINIQGGESIFHPNIIEILEYLKEKKSKHTDWDLNVSLITNAVIGKSIWEQIASRVNYFTISFHAEMLEKQQKMFKENVLYLKSINSNFQVAVIMHPKFWNKCIDMIEWCKQHNIQYHDRQIDHHWLDFRFNYSNEQTEFLIGKTKPSVTETVIKFVKGGLDLSSYGRACCGKECLIQNQQTEVIYVKGNNFNNWHCSVNEFFLYVRQLTGEVFTNKDCKMNLNSEIGAIGNLKESQKILQELKTMIKTKNLPVIQCKKSSCWCGLCAPKSSDLTNYKEIIRKYRAD